MSESTADCLGHFASVGQSVFVCVPVCLSVRLYDVREDIFGVHFSHEGGEDERGNECSSSRYVCMQTMVISQASGQLNPVQTE